MAENLFFSNQPDRSDLVHAFNTEAQSAREFVDLLKERAEEITETDIDLSCTTPYNSYQTMQAIAALHSTAGVDLGVELPTDEILAVMQLEDLPTKDLQRYFAAITLGYRQAALNILLGIGTHYKKAEGILPDFGPSRNNPPGLRGLIIEKMAIPVISNQAFQKTEMESDLQEIRVGTSEAWGEMFTGRNDKTLAARFLERKISENGLQKAVSQMNGPRFKF
jgi:hypothetical protein